MRNECKTFAVNYTNRQLSRITQGPVEGVHRCQTPGYQIKGTEGRGKDQGSDTLEKEYGNP